MNEIIDISNVVLESDRLILRPFELGDLDDLYEYAKVPGVGEMAGWMHHESIDESKRILNMFINGKKTFAIVYKENNKVIGSLGIEEYNEHHLPELDNLSAREIGYVLSKDYWNKGLMTEAVKRVIKYLFDEVKLEVLVCGHYSFNDKSYRVQEKCGFVHYKREELHYSSVWDKEDSGWYSLLFRSKEFDFRK